MDSLMALFASSRPITSSHFTLGFSLMTSSLKEAFSCGTIWGPFAELPLPLLLSFPPANTVELAASDSARALPLPLPFPLGPIIEKLEPSCGVSCGTRPCACWMAFTRSW